MLDNEGLRRSAPAHTTCVTNEHFHSAAVAHWRFISICGILTQFKTGVAKCLRSPAH